jgi:hypothetical protein
VFFALLAIFLLVGEGREREDDWSAVVLGLAVLQKLWPVLLVPLMLPRIATMTQRFRYVAICAAVVLGSVAAYIIAFESSVDLIVDQVLRYESPVPLGGGLLLVVDRLPEFFAGRDAFVDWWIDHGTVVTAFAVVGAMATCIMRSMDVVSSTIAVLCVLFLLVPEGGSFYHYLWIIPFGLIAGDRIFTAVIALTTTGRYIGLGFFSGGLYMPPPDYDFARWVTEHEWILGVVTWLTFALWGAFVMTRGSAVAPYAAESTSRAAVVPDSSPGG